MDGFFNQASHLFRIAVGQTKGVEVATHVEVVEEEHDMLRIARHVIGGSFMHKVDHGEAHTVVAAASFRWLGYTKTLPSGLVFSSPA
jgi:hypothetical protein